MTKNFEVKVAEAITVIALQELKEKGYGVILKTPTLLVVIGDNRTVERSFWEVAAAANRILEVIERGLEKPNVETQTSGLEYWETH